MDTEFTSSNRRISKSKQTLQYSIWGLTVLITTIAAYWGRIEALVVVLAAIAAIILLRLLVRELAVGYILLLFGGIFVPFYGPGGINASMIIIILMSCLWIMDKVIVQKRLEFVRSRPIRPAFYFMIVTIAAFLMGQVLWYIAAIQAPLNSQLGGFAIYFFSLAALIMTADVIKSDRWLKIFMWFFVGLSAIYMLARVMGFSMIDQFYAYGFTANSMLWTWLVAVTLGQAIYNRELSKWQRIVLFSIVVITMYVAIVQATDWRSGWVPPLVVIIVLVGLRFRKLALASIPIVLIAFIYLLQQQIAAEEWSWGTRLEAWRIVLEVSRVNPILGLGFANYYWYVSLFSILGYYTTFISHSQYVDLIAQTGIVGLVCFLWVLFEVGRLAWSLAIRLQDGFGRGYAYGVLAGLAGVVVAAFLVDWVLPFTYNIGLTGFRASILPWIFFGGLISIEKIRLKEIGPGEVEKTTWTN